MKQYLETASTCTNVSNVNQIQIPNNFNQSQNDETEELQGKGLAKSLLAKWKSMENVKEKETTPDQNRTRADSKERSPVNESSSEDYLPQSGIAKSLLNKWQNIDTNTISNKERKGPRPITPPPTEELERNKV